MITGVMSETGSVSLCVLSASEKHSTNDYDEQESYTRFIKDLQHTDTSVLFDSD